MLRLTVLACLVLAAAFVAPSAGAASYTETTGKLYLSTTGTAQASPNTGLPSDGRIFVADDGAYWWRVFLDPTHLTFVQCVDGAGGFYLNGAFLAPATCSLRLDGTLAVTTFSVQGPTAGPFPGALGYLGTIRSGFGGTGVFAMA